MRLTYDRFKMRTDEFGKKHLDIEMTLLLSAPKRVRLKFSIPETTNGDAIEDLHSYKDVTLWIDDRIDGDLS